MRVNFREKKKFYILSFLWVDSNWFIMVMAYHMIIHMYIFFPQRRAEKLNINFLVFTNIFYYTEIFILELDCK